MTRTLALALLLLSAAAPLGAAPVAGAPAKPAAPASKAAPSVYTVPVDSIDGKPGDLSAHKGKVLLIVNVASKCGYTPQYEGLEKLYRKYAAQGLVVIGVPTNDFGGQEPGGNAEIAQFCRKTYGVTFPMMAKVPITGKDKSPLYALLTSEGFAGREAGDVRWNFEKFLVARDGTLAGRFGTKVAPEDPSLVAAIEKALARK